MQVAEKTLTSGEAAISHAFDITESGVYVVELFARDKLGRVQTLSADLYVGGPTPQAWQKSRDGVFELKPDKPTYTPGDVGAPARAEPVHDREGAGRHRGARRQPLPLEGRVRRARR